MFSRFHDDKARIQKQMEMMTYSERYYLNTPGQGTYLPFMEDPHIRLQRWGGNMYSYPVHLEGELLGIKNKNNRHIPGEHERVLISTLSKPQTYSSHSLPITDETRITYPAWELRGIEIPRWETPFLNPLFSLEKPFQENINTRILEKDYFIPHR